MKPRVDLDVLRRLHERLRWEDVHKLMPAIIAELEAGRALRLDISCECGVCWACQSAERYDRAVSGGG